MHPPVNDKIALLRSILDDDEAYALAVKSLGSTTDMGGRVLHDSFSHTRTRFHSEDGAPYTEHDQAAKEHFDRHDPQNVLLMVRTVRALLEEYGKLCNAQNVTGQTSKNSGPSSAAQSADS